MYFTYPEVTASLNGTGNDSLRQLFHGLEEKWRSKVISRCDHLLEPRAGQPASRGDSQTWANFGETEELWGDYVDDNWQVTKLVLSDQLCPHLYDRFDIYGILGTGSFGTVLAAREKDPPHAQFAIKVLAARFNEDEGTSEDLERFRDFADNNADRYTFVEAYAMLYMIGHDELAQVDSVFLHPPLISIVMKPFGVDWEPEMGTFADLNLAHWDNARHRVVESRIFPSHPGSYLSTDDKKARLKEYQVCKVMSHLFSGIRIMLQRHIIHDYLKADNFLVSQQCEAQPIDFDRLRFAPNLEDFQMRAVTHHIGWSHLISPEMAVHLLYHPDLVTEDPDGHLIRIHRDAREEQVYKLGCIMYELLHGYAPWEDPEHYAPDDPNATGGRKTKVRDWARLRPFDFEESQRRLLRIAHQKLPIREFQTLAHTDERREMISQDAQDLLRAIFDQDPSQRPTILELASFPWFQGWWRERPDDKFNRSSLVPKTRDEFEVAYMSAF